MKIKSNTFYFVTLITAVVFMVWIAMGGNDYFVKSITFLVLIAVYYFVGKYGVCYDRQLQFFEFRRRAKNTEDFVDAFQYSLNCVERLLAEKSVVNKLEAECSICGFKDEGKYKHQFTYNGFIWSEWDSCHKMYAHVENGCEQHGYWRPEPDFVNMIMEAFEEISMHERYPTV